MNLISTDKNKKIEGEQDIKRSQDEFTQFDKNHHLKKSKRKVDIKRQITPL